MIAVFTLLAATAFAQDSLSVRDAARLAQKDNPGVRAAASRVSASQVRMDSARSGYLPKVNYLESWQRSNNPVFVFSTLLTQRRFSEANFRLDALNNPASVNNFQSVLSAEQTLYDGGLTKRQIASAGLQKKMTAEEQSLLEMNLAAGAARAYFGVLLAEEARKVALQAVASAEADLRRAETVRNAGMATDADVLSLQVHLAAMKEQEIQRRSDVEVARAALNEVTGAPLDTVRSLTTTLQPLPSLALKRDDYEKRATEQRPDSRQASLAVSLAETQSTMARAAYLPQVSLRGALEADRGKFVTQAGGNWFAGVSLRWNLFNGFADRGRIQESEYAVKANQAQKKQVDAGLQLQVRRAWADLQSATERIQVADTAITQAEESLRITSNRYEGGLSTVTDLLRNQLARLESSLRRLMAVHDQRVAATMLELAAGTLTPDSEVLN